MREIHCKHFTYHIKGITHLAEVLKILNFVIAIIHKLVMEHRCVSLVSHQHIRLHEVRYKAPNTRNRRIVLDHKPFWHSVHLTSHKQPILSYMCSQHSLVRKAHSNLHAGDEIGLVLRLKVVHSRLKLTRYHSQFITFLNRVTVLQNNCVIVKENRHDHGGSAALQNKTRDAHEFTVGVG